MSDQQSISIEVPVLARVEGEGALELRIDGGELRELKLRIYEPPRYFEKFLEGRQPQQVIDMVARICGICPVAYQMTAVHALEQVFDVRITDWVRNMRRVFYCGEWLQSHSLHVHLLAAPDFFGCGNVAELAAQYPAEVRRGLRLQTLGNDLIALFGGRSVHPVGVCPGGFFKAPSIETVQAMHRRLVDARNDAVALLHWVAGWDVPRQTQDFLSVALSHPTEYPFNAGNIRVSDGSEIAVEDFEEFFQEQQVPHSTALHCLYNGTPYLVGPLARLNLNASQLPGEIQEEIAKTGIRFPSQNMFHSALARAVEILYVIDEAQRILAGYALPEHAAATVQPRAGTACWATEAPRGLLWHRYSVNEQGAVTTAKIVPPTSQNQARIEQDLANSLTAVGLSQPEEVLRKLGETVIRNYDPCISCATHFLKLNVTNSSRQDPVD